MPVIAVDPDANARSTSRTPTPSVAVSAGWRTGTKAVPRRIDQADHHQHEHRDDEHVCRRRKQRPSLAHAAQVPRKRIAITADPMGTASGPSDGIADVIAATPEATDTATVRM